ncbi:MAG: hypothetical protein ACK5H1_10090 [Tenacibaculum sp.]
MAEGVKVKGEKSFFLGVGWNIEDSMEIALEKAGKEYDLLVDGVVRYTSLPLIVSVAVEGTAVSSRIMKKSLEK